MCCFKVIDFGTLCVLFKLWRSISLFCTCEFIVSWKWALFCVSLILILLVIGSNSSSASVLVFLFKLAATSKQICCNIYWCMGIYLLEKLIFSDLRFFEQKLGYPKFLYEGIERQFLYVMGPITTAIFFKVCDFKIILYYGFIYLLIPFQAVISKGIVWVCCCLRNCFY